MGNVRSIEREYLIRATKNGKTFFFKKKYPSVILNPVKDKDGYVIVSLSKRTGRPSTPRVHRLVASAFIKNPENKNAINHKNSIKNDNRVENIEWCTNKENTNHMIKFGKGMASGENHHNSIFKEEDIKKIRALLKMGFNSAAIARLYNCHWTTIHSIQKGETWKKKAPKK